MTLLTEHGKSCGCWKVFSVPHVSLDCWECGGTRKAEHDGTEGLTKIHRGLRKRMTWNKMVCRIGVATIITMRVYN